MLPLHDERYLAELLPCPQVALSNGPGRTGMRCKRVREEPMSAVADESQDALTLLNEIFDGYPLRVEATDTSLSQTSNCDVCATRRVPTFSRRIEW